MLRLAFDFIITWRETRTRPNAYSQFYHSQLTQPLTYLFFAIPYVLILPVNYNTLIYHANLAILSENAALSFRKVA